MVDAHHLVIVPYNISIDPPVTQCESPFLLVFMKAGAVPWPMYPLFCSSLRNCVTICNHACQKLFSFIVTRPRSLLPLPPPRISTRHVVKLPCLEPSTVHVVKLQNLEPFSIVRYDVKLHLPSLGPDARYGTKLQLWTSRPSRPSWSPRQPQTSW